MSSPESAPPPRFTSVFDLLSHVATQAAFHEENARSSFHVDLDREQHLLNLQRRALLISELPAMVDELKMSIGIVPEEVEIFAQTYAQVANEALASNSAFMLGTILDLTPGNLITDPNDLERFATRFEPSQEG